MERKPRSERGFQSGGEGGPGGMRDDEPELIEKVVYINRVAKVVKGGRRFSFCAIVVKGDGAGKVGLGVGKANEVPEAMRKAGERALRSMTSVHIKDGTIPHEAFIKFGAARLVLRPAGPGTGIIAGGAVRAVLEAAGVKNVLTKVVGTTNKHNVVRAAFKALTTMTSVEDVAKRRGKSVEAITAR